MRLDLRYTVAKHSSFATLFALAALSTLLYSLPPSAHAAKRASGPTVWVLTKTGQYVEGVVNTTTLKATIDGSPHDIPLRDLLSLQTASPASDMETPRITSGLETIAANTDRVKREAAVADLTDIGLPVLTPLLTMYKDTDMHEPYPLYRLFARIMPPTADRIERDQDLIRMANGQNLRGQVADTSLTVTDANGKASTFKIADLRRLAVRRKLIEKVCEVHALRHCVQVEFLDSGVGVSTGSQITGKTTGFVRLSFNVDGWACDADGLKVPGPHYASNLVEGFPFGALLGRVGAAGPRWVGGRQFTKRDMGTGRLYLGVNDNPHWQNNIGSFRVQLHAQDAYDLGDPQ